MSAAAIARQFVDPVNRHDIEAMKALMMEEQ
jgi:hypothetical protein